MSLSNFGGDWEKICQHMCACMHVCRAHVQTLVRAAIMSLQARVCMVVIELRKSPNAAMATCAPPSAMLSCEDPNCTHMRRPTEGHDVSPRARKRDGFSYMCTYQGCHVLRKLGVVHQRTHALRVELNGCCQRTCARVVHVPLRAAGGGGGGHKFLHILHGVLLLAPNHEGRIGCGRGHAQLVVSIAQKGDKRGVD